MSYLANDGQGTVSETLDGSGNVTSAQLYTPYGTVRYSSGSSPTTLGYTGQRADGTTGLDYYHARYYDPVAGQFISADTVDDGLNRYGYVAGNPTTNTDPSGHKLWAGGDSGGGGSNTPPDCHVTHTCKTGGGGGGGGGGSCTHNCEPGCKGTIDQCNSWIQGRGALISDLQGNENGAWAVLGLVTGAMDIWDLVVDKGKGFITTLIDIVSIVGDALFTMNYALQFIQEKFGVDTTGLRHIVDMLSKFVNVIAGPLKAFRKGMNWLVQQVLNFSWDAFVTSFRISNVPGILMTVLSQFWGGFLEDIRNNVVELAEHAVQGYVSAQEEQITNIQGQSIDAFCSAHRASCQGY